MRIFVAALSTETNTFSPTPTGRGAFEEAGIRRGAASMANPSGVVAVLDAIREVAVAGAHEVVEGLCATAQPLGVTVRSAYESLRGEILEDLREAMPVGAVILLLHGAMVAEGYDDCEGDLIARVREVVGSRVPIGVVLDLHCHFSELMRTSADVIVCYKEYPHTDARERAAEVCRLVIAAAIGRIRPAIGVHDCRMVGLWHTTDEPMRGFVARMQALEGHDGVLSVSFGHGFPWGDVADGGAKVWVVTDGDRPRAEALAARLGREVWEMRNATAPRRLTIDEAIDRALAATGGPVVLADCDDNPGGGAPGDSTFILRRLLERKVGGFAVGCFWDLGAVQICAGAGEGASFDLRLGGKCGPSSGDPVDLRVTVRTLLQCHSQSVFGSADPLGRSAWVATDDGIDVVLTSLRRQVVGTDAFTGLGIDLASRKGIVVKSAQHFRTAFGAIAKEALQVATPGLLTQDFASLPYRKRSLGYWPRVADPFAQGGRS